MMQQNKPDDYVIATGKAHSIREFLDVAFGCIGVEDWKKFVKHDPKFMRPAEVDVLCGDAKKAKDKLGWLPKTTFSKMVSNMVVNDIKIVSGV